ncbi:hypothetical protein ACWC9U_37970, partial [Streptomyces sp. 900116325]
KGAVAAEPAGRLSCDRPLFHQDASLHLDEVAPGTHEARVAAQSDRETAVRDGRSRDRGHAA